MIHRGSRAWQLLTVAVIAVPWLLRDELATRLDSHSSLAAEVQAAAHQETARADQATEQRETRDRLMRIEILVAKAAKETSAAGAEEAKAELVSQSARRESEELVNSATTLQGLLARLPVTPQPVPQAEHADRKLVDQWLGVDSIAAGGLTQPQLMALAAKVATTAQGYADAPNPAEGDFDEWNNATAALHVAYQDLVKSAQAAETASAAAAQWARWAAWLFTALGALMIGDWSRVVRSRDADAAFQRADTAEAQGGGLRKAA